MTGVLLVRMDAELTADVYISKEINMERHDNIFLSLSLSLFLSPRQVVGYAGRMGYTSASTLLYACNIIKYEKLKLNGTRAWLTVIPECCKKMSGTNRVPRKHSSM